MSTSSLPRSRHVSRGRAAAVSAALACLAVLFPSGSAQTVHAAGPIPTGYRGYDISWPQCSGTNGTSTHTPPGPAQFGVVGVGGGRSFTTNACASAQAAWARSLAAPLTVYIVLDSPHQDGAAVTRGETGPAGSCAAPPNAMACNDYNYGWNNAAFEFAYASGLGITSQVWWLDVETTDCWDFACDGGYDTQNNWRVLQGNIDYLRSQGVTPGIYSTAYQFGRIVGTSYAPGVPNWLADYNTGDPSQDCGPARGFGGGQVWQVQTAPVTLSDGRQYDPDYSCPSPHGYWLDASDGGVFAFGNAPFYGSMGGHPLNQPIVGMSAPPQGGGYWMVASDGGIFSFGGAQFHGSMGGKPLNKPVVAMTSTTSGNGYWMVATDGGIFSFGDAQFHGSMGGHPLNQPILGMAPTPDGGGYWEVASDGGIFSFGDAQFHGSMGGHPLNKPIVGMAPTHDGGGYWLVASDGGIFCFGDAQFYGSAGSAHLSSPVVAMAVTPDGLGYWMTTAAGDVLTFGDALGYGSLTGDPLAAPIEGVAATP